MPQDLSSPPWSADYLASLCRTEGTWRGYRANWRDFARWCADRGYASLPAAPETIGAYIAERGRALAPATVQRHLSAIVVFHRQAGHNLDRRHPAIADVLAGLRRVKGVAPAQKAALLTEDVVALVEVLPRDLVGLRDRSLLLLGLAGGFRRSELAALERRDLAFTSIGLVVTVRRSKEDQDGRGELKGIPFGQGPDSCPVAATRAYLLAAGLGEGRLYRRVDRWGNLSGPSEGLSGAAVAEVIRRAVRTLGRREGWTAAEIARRIGEIGGHSLRAGMVTSAIRAGASLAEIAAHSGHRRLQSLATYHRRADAITDSVAGRIGL